MRYLVKISYDGSKFYGFQRQNDKVTVQNEIEKYLSLYFRKEILIKGAGRTDRGVHAKGQFFHFDVIDKVSCYKLKRFLNNNINDIRVKSIKEVSDDFHARFSTIKKHYEYKISTNKKYYSSEYILWVKEYNLKKMKEASKEFIGVHNFQNFVSGERDNYDCIIYKIKFVKRFGVLHVHFYGKSFYRYMVRNIIGALLDVGKGKSDKEYIIKLLNSKKTDKMLSTAPAKGLTLVNIYYKMPKKS